MQINGAEGMLMSENQVPNGIVGYKKQGIYSSAYKHSFPQRYAESYVGAINHFFDVLQGKYLLWLLVVILVVVKVVVVMVGDNNTNSSRIINFSLYNTFNAI